MARLCLQQPKSYKKYWLDSSPKYGSATAKDESLPGKTEEERGRDRQTERDMNRLPPMRVQTGDRTHNVLVHRAMLQPTEPPGQGERCVLYLSFYAEGWK